MTWFKVDDGFWSHPKTRKVLAKAPSALALWVVAGSWSSDKLTDGFVPGDQLPWLIPQGAEEMAQELVTARFWRRTRGGFQFHEWTTSGDGTKRNPTREEVETERRKKAEAGRKGGLASGKSRSKSEARAEAGASQIVQPPTRPDPKGRVGTGRSLGDSSVTRTREDPPPPKCAQHEHLDEPPPCGACADARKARTRWDAAEAERVRKAPKCRRHRGQLAGNCALCRSEQLGEPS